MDKIEDSTEDVTATVNFSIYGKPLQMQITASTAPTRPSRMLPLFRAMSESFVGRAVEHAETAGLKISCAKGCGACCRQMIPISEFEARRLREFVGEMPEPRRSAVIKKFEEAKERMSEASLLEKLREPERINKEGYRAFALEYFHQGVACPFLEEESCSIYAERPLVCREYLVVSPAENCKRSGDDPIKVLSIPVEMSEVVKCFNAEQEGGWLPLILALEWAETHPDDSPERPGTELLRELFQNLTRKNIPDYKSER